jgi:mannosyltransferase OCH1-like enzyme
MAGIIDLPFLPIGDQKSRNAPIQKIPPIVYQTWERNTFGRRHRKSILGFREANSDLDFVLFDRAARDNYIEEAWGDSIISKIYFQSNFGALKADIFRYCILLDRGGYYFDISKGLDTKLTTLHKPTDVGVIAFESNPSSLQGPTSVAHPKNLVVQWGLGFESNHPILKNHIERIEGTYGEFFGKAFPHPKQAILEFTGPIAFTKTVHAYAKNHGMDHIAQLGIDFLGHGIFSLRGSGSRYAVSPSYALAQNERILG